MKISILSNTNVDSIIRRLSKTYTVYESSGYDNWVGEILGENLDLDEFEPNSIFFLLDGHELLKPYENEYENIRSNIDDYFNYIVSYAERREKVNIFISNLDLPQRKIQSIKDIRMEKIIEQYWYEKLMEVSGGRKNIYIFDIKNLIEEMGREKFYSDKLWYLGGIKYSHQGEKSIIREIDRYIKAIQGRIKKCLVLDLDNTLWGGVVGEEGIACIELSDVKEGARYKDFQRRIKELKELGIILTIASKNNYNDAMEVIKKHKDMVLREEDFVLTKINWDMKYKNIGELAEELNIGLDSFVFIDDNPIERSSVKELIPDIEVPEFPIDSSDLEKHIIKIYKDNFMVLETTIEDKNKSAMYRANMERERESEKAVSFSDFLESLETKINIWQAKEEDIERITQLTQKTNQFNLTTIRYTASDIKRYMESKKYDLYIASVEDKFGDNGKVILLILEKEGNAVEIETFIMSCRVMGRSIEDAVIDFIENKYKEQNYDKLTASYIPTERNKPVKTLFDRLGYKIIDRQENGYKKYELELKKDKPERHIYGELNKI